MSSVAEAPLPIDSQAVPAARHWRAWGRLVTSVTTVGIVGIDLYKRRYFPESTPLGLAGMELWVVLAVLGSMFGVGSKIADLTAEHGLRPAYRPLGYGMIALAFLAILWLMTSVKQAEWLAVAIPIAAALAIFAARRVLTR